MNIHVFILFFVICFAKGQDRQITPVLNPGCTTCTDQNKNPLVYIKAKSSHDAIHQLWDFTRGIPTVIYMIASANSTLNITWDDNARPVEFHLDNGEKPTYSFATAIDKIYEYDDVDDDGHISPKCPQRSFSLRDLSWRRSESLLTDKEAEMLVQADFKQGRKSGTVAIKLDLLPYRAYAALLPRLIHSANSSLADVRLVNLTAAYNATRFALHMLLVATDPRTDSWSFVMRKSLDDEHTPGVFEIIEMSSPRDGGGGRGGYLQFRPVAYTDAQRDVSSSTDTHVSKFNRTWLPGGSTLRQFYSPFDNDQLLVQDFFVSFGLSGDGFYKQHNFTSWSFSVGYGTPPIETFSVFVIIIISIGLGVPVLLALSGVTYVLFRRCRQRNAPARLTNEE